MNKLLPALLLAALLGLSQCKKNDSLPAEQLPPATQTGANTFGCLVNGQVWTPRGNNGRSNYAVDYDPGLNGGLFSLKTYRYPDESANFQDMTMGVNSNFRVGTYSFSSSQRTLAAFNDIKTHCLWISTDTTTTYRRGTLTITRLDAQAGIVAGTFAFTLYKAGCDSIRVTQGRFDRKL